MYPLEVKVFDGITEVIVPLTVTVTPANGATPVFTPTEYTVELREDSPILDRVTVYTATDTDAAPDNIVKYEISGLHNKFKTFAWGIANYLKREN